jgi:hypothetical protein
MSDTDDCIQRLSKMYQDGTRTISWSQLLPDTKLTQRQIQSIVEILQLKSVIKSVYQQGQLLPYQIDILPGSVEAASQIKNPYSFDELKRKTLSSTVFGIAAFIGFVILAIVGFAKYIWPKLFSE